ncbi:MAG: hypothetical protein WCR49_08880, partial [Opitutae bacterium]
WLIGSSNLILTRPRWQIFCGATAFATGIGNPYFGFAYCQLLALALAYQGLNPRRRNLTLGLTCFAIFAATLVAMNYSSLFALLGEGTGLLQRNFSSTEIYGLRPIELLIPHASHRWSIAAEIGERYAAVTSLKGELFSPYLGLAGIGGLLVIATDTVVRLRQRRVGFRPAYAVTFLWFTLFFIVGGLNSLVAFAGFDLFRAGNRYSIYLLAVALLALTSWASRKGRHLTPWPAFILVAAAVLVGLWDQLPRSRPPAELLTLRNKIAVDHRLGRCLETQLPPDATIFLLPVTPFLEQPPVHGMTDYELFRPWLFSAHPRFSYGLLAGAKPLRWQKWIAAQPVNVMCAALEETGYTALYFHKAAFTDFGTALRQQLTALGKKLLFDEGDHVVFALEPAKKIYLPDLNDARLANTWNRAAATEDQLQIYATAGWFALEQLGEEYWRWAGDVATVSIWCPSNQPRLVSLRFMTTALRPAQLIATSANKQIIWQAALGQQTSLQVNLPLTLQPGANRITFQYHGSLTRPSAADSRRLGFRLINLHAEFDPHP